MDRKYIDDNHIVARYLADQLSDPDREQFEAYYLEHPEIVQQMEATARFKAGLMQLHASGELESLISKRSWQQPRYLAIAASIAAIAITTTYLWQSRPGAQPLMVAERDLFRTWSRQPFPQGGEYALIRTRSVAYDAEINLADAVQAIELRVLPEFEAHPPRYQVSLQRLAEQSSVPEKIEGLPLDTSGVVIIYLNSARLQAGSYQLIVAGDEGTTAASMRSSFLINVRPSPGT